MSSSRGFILPKWPLTTVLPVAISTTMLGISLILTLIVTSFFHAHNTASLEQKAAIFLDAMAGHVVQETSIDADTAQAALLNALRFPSILREEAVALGWATNGSHEVLHHPGNSTEPRLSEALERALSGTTEVGFQIGPDQRGLLTRSYEHRGEAFAITALFDAREVVDANRNALNTALAINAALAISAALITFAITRSALSPLRAFTDRLAGEVRDTKVDRQHAFASAELANLETALLRRRQNEESRSVAIRQLAQAERDALLARLAATLAHEVRNPLAGILNALSTFRRYGDDRAVREETLDIVESGLRSLERITDVTLSAYRKRAGHQRVGARDLLDLDVLIEPEARRKDLTVAWNVPEDLAISADADALRQVLVNLLLNACKASPAGGHVSLDVKAGADGTRVSVTDMGGGMPAEVLAYLQAGQHKELPSSRELGIWIVSALADDIGARLSVESRSGQGTKVTIIIPPTATVEQAKRMAV